MTMKNSSVTSATRGKTKNLLYHLLRIVLFFPTAVVSFSINTNLGQSRVEFLKNILQSTGVAVSLVAINPQLANAAAVEQAEGKILRAGGKCAYGVGDGCDELSGGNEYIKQLQMKSAKNKEATEKEYLSAYQMKNYPDFFASLSPPKYMVKQPDGSIKLYEEEELTNLKKEGKIKLEKPKAMGGKVADVTQKPIMVLIE